MGKRFLLLVILSLLIIQVAKPQSTDPNLGIIPAPVSVKKSSGEFVLNQETIIAADTVNNKAVQFLVAYLQNKYQLHNTLKANTGNNVNNTIILTAAGTEGLPPEGYRLTITPQQITIVGNGA